MVKKVYNDLNVVRLSEGNPRSANSLNVLAIQKPDVVGIFKEHCRRAHSRLARVHYRGKTQDRAWLNGCSAMSQEKIVPNDYPCKTPIGSNEEEDEDKVPIRK
ncbi:hypothetical protein HZH68_011504 [Vespula germanica]|uniref:Uncharacterized protein n=1 Tax=Vespula germanica TaxID=30212 RepID=A0A834JQT8_VESGE|nr:hypothetical protein HZH68_011504 [Vespula germanica]